ncbi:YqeG family HAD IIIA-type phosphatase [Chengkuizengella axinellae]|uniref:YqeG family HAD IIIA-type phosphatase n=1 Tax=Chengkuizengella axinellae TaxID=3064388 RepID=A0ABT9IUR5_9BACL|nr:YqeG family HAD IIIA-type phosphatase [Chengkuizengella sp. 2205SS18-9]MDP5273028.1 YqeG family HAD IIIA-type phosphatase [Chengkuizengella sp. 2205SS18-9]
MIRKFLPYLHVNSIYEIDIDALKKAGVKGIITDLDNTLVGAKEALATPELIEWLKQLEQAGFKVVIVSNNNHARVSTFAKPLNLPYLPNARKPANLAFKKALQMTKLKPSEIVVIGDQLLTDVFGGNRLGLNTILVKPVSIHEDSFFTRINRRVEKIILSKLKKKGLMPWED